MTNNVIIRVESLINESPNSESHLLQFFLFDSLVRSFSSPFLLFLFLIEALKLLDGLMKHPTFSYKTTTIKIFMVEAHGNIFYSKCT